MANEIQKGVKYPLIKAYFDKAVAAYNYQALLTSLSSIVVTKDNVNEDLTKDVREIIKRLDAEKEEQCKEPIQWHKDILSCHKEVRNPLQEQIDRIAAEKKVVALAIQQEEQKQRDEQTRIANAKAAIINYTNKVALGIAAAQSYNEIVLIEKAMGSEKTKTSVYHEFLPELVEKLDALRPQVKVQKENLKRLQELAEKEKDAELSGDIVALTEIKGQKEYAEAIVKETIVRVHETAYEQAVTVEVIAPEVADSVPKGRTNWKWRVEDIKLLQKKMPHLVKLVPNEEAINELLKTKRVDGSLANKMEENLFGLVFFNDKTFK